MKSLINSEGHVVATGEVLTVEGGFALADTFYPDAELTLLDSVPPEPLMAWNGSAWVADAPARLAEVARIAPGLTAEIDAAVAAITARYAPFLEEYKARETQARAFAAAGYTGEVPTQVAAFATPAGLTPQVATLTIIGQADALRAAQDALGVLRMRKYEVMRAATPEVARTAHAEVMAAIRSIAAGLS